MFLNISDYAAALVSLGKAQYRMGLFADSLESLSHAEAIRKTCYGENHPQVCFYECTN